MKRSPAIAGAEAAWHAALILIAAFYAWASGRYLNVLLVPFGDAWAHLTAIRRTMEIGVFPGDLFYGGGASPPYYSLSHVALAAVARLTGLPPHEIWVAAPPFLAVLDLAAAFLFLHRLTGDVRVAVIGAAVELMVKIPDAEWSSLPMPRAMAVLPRYLCWYAYVRARRERRTAWLAAAGVALGACMGTHLFVGGLCALGLALLEVALVPERRRIAPLFATGAIGIAVASPWLLNFARAWLDAPRESQAVFRMARLTWSFAAGPLTLRILDPLTVYGALATPLWIAVAAGLIVSLRRLARGAATSADRYAVFGLGAAVLFTFTPLYQIVIAAFGVWSPRIFLVAPLPLLAGLGGVGIADGLRRSGAPRPRRVAAATAALALAAWTAASLWVEFREPLSQAEIGQEMRRGGPFGDWNVAAALAKSGPLPRLVLSDPDTSYAIPYLFGSHVLTMPAAHGSAFADHDTRQGAARAFYKSGASDRQLREIADQWGIDAVAIAVDGQWPSRGQGALLLQQLRRMPEFSDTGCCGSVVFLRYRHRD